MLSKHLAGQLALCLGLAVMLGIQLVGLTDPLTDAHAWRQTDTAAISRNFYRHGFQLLYPEVDWGGSGSNYVESEFPLIPYLDALLYGALGFHDYLGRVVSIGFSVGTAIVTGMLARYYFGQPVSWLSVWGLSASPLFLFFGRAFMPEPAMLFFSLLFLYAGVRWLGRPGTRWFWVCAGAGALAFMLKLPALAMLGPMAALALWSYGWRALWQPRLWWLSALVLVPTALWYLHAADLRAHTGLTFNIWSFGGDKWGNLAIWSNPEFYRTMAQRLAGEVISRYAIWLSLVGLLLPGRTRLEESGRRLLLIWAASLVLSVFIVANGNTIHEYYQMLFVPLAVIAFGRAIGWLQIRWAAISAASTWRRGLLCSGSVLFLVYISGVFWSSFQFDSIVFRQLAFHSNQVVYDAAQSVAQLTKSSDLIVVAYEENRLPELFYYADRKGWTTDYQQCSLSDVAAKSKLGAQYVVLVLSILNDKPNEPGDCGVKLRAQFTPVASGPYWQMYALN